MRTGKKLLTLSYRRMGLCVRPYSSVFRYFSRNTRTKNVLNKFSIRNKTKGIKLRILKKNGYLYTKIIL